MYLQIKHASRHVLIEMYYSSYRKLACQDLALVGFRVDTCSHSVISSECEDNYVMSSYVDIYVSEEM